MEYKKLEGKEMNNVLDIYLELAEENHSRKAKDDPDYLKKFQERHRPKMFILAPSDLRAAPSDLLSCSAGEVFCYYNLGALVNPHDFGLLATLEHALDDLGIKEIIIANYTDSWVVKKALEDNSHNSGYLSDWLEFSKPLVSHISKDSDEKISFDKPQMKSLVNSCLKQQLKKLYNLPLIKRYIYKH